VHPNPFASQRSRRCPSSSQLTVLGWPMSRMVAVNHSSLSSCTGTADFSAPVEVCGRPTAGAIAYSEYVEFPDAGHGMYSSHHEPVNNELLRFFRNTDTGSWTVGGDPAASLGSAGSSSSANRG
jgi:hypothetical protein